MSMVKAPTKYAAGVTVPKKPTRREKATNQNDSLLKACTGKNGASFLSWASIVLRLRIRAIPRRVTARFVQAITLNRTGCTGQLAISLVGDVSYLRVCFTPILSINAGTKREKTAAPTEFGMSVRSWSTRTEKKDIPKPKPLRATPIARARFCNVASGQNRPSQGTLTELTFLNH
jgi:hypothetical protein